MAAVCADGLEELDIPTTSSIQDEMAPQDEPTSSISKTAAWVEKIELQPQHHRQSTSEQIAPRAAQEIEQPQQKKPKQKEDHDGPDAKSQKYDRQLRLWGANGQKALEESHVLLVNNGCGTVGIEALKNLVLPGMIASQSIWMGCANFDHRHWQLHNRRQQACH